MSSPVPASTSTSTSTSTLTSAVTSTPIQRRKRPRDSPEDKDKDKDEHNDSLEVVFLAVVKAPVKVKTHQPDGEILQFTSITVTVVIMSVFLQIIPVMFFRTCANASPACVGPCRILPATAASATTTLSAAANWWTGRVWSGSDSSWVPPRCTWPSGCSTSSWTSTRSTSRS